MQNTNNKLTASLIAGLTKGWHGFLWMLKILTPISLLTALLAWSGLIDWSYFIFEPLMGVLGLPPAAAFPLIAGLLTGPYGAIAAMAPLALTIEQMTLIAIFLLNSHNLIQEGVIQNQSGLSFVKATLSRLTASILTVMLVSWWFGPETASWAGMGAPAAMHLPLVAMLKNWAIEMLVLSGKILAIITPLMIGLEIMKSYHWIDRIVKVTAPFLTLLGLKKQTGFLWMTATIFGLTYGAAVIMAEAKTGLLSKDELEHLQISIGINHSMIEDPALFLPLGINMFWLWAPRLIAAIVAVQLVCLYKRIRCRFFGIRKAQPSATL